MLKNPLMSQQGRGMNCIWSTVTHMSVENLLISTVLNMQLSNCVLAGRIQRLDDVEVKQA